MLDGAGATDRYEVVRRIGAGGMGVVYEAEDRERGQRVALKTIANPDVEKVYQLKREFRVLADLSHPNLVALYDLVVDGAACFFTMELLDGEDLLTHLWRRNASSELALAATTTGDAAVPLTNEDIVDAPTMITDQGPCRCDLQRVREALPALARGLHALHAAGKIHRDVKPSNIHVTGDGRVVLLDFGLVAELEGRRSSEAGTIVGTVAYMAPEQCAGDVPLTAAADWYAVGVVLFQALTGRLPFDGSPARVMLDKQTRDAPSPSRYARGVPDDLDLLCRQLLERDPADRPGGRTLLSRLGVGIDDTGRLHVPSLSRESGFAGRDEELARLMVALGALGEQRGSVAVVRAPSGMGKTALVNRFFERARAEHPDLLLLRGRCFEREDVPYKAIDDLIDELSDWWLELTPREAQGILPRDACMLPTLFPVLGRVPAIADAPRTRTATDPQEQRTLGFAALRETLQRLADRRRVVLFLDDMQWVDRDTTTLLADLMRAPDPPALLLVLASRVEGSEPVLQLTQRMDAASTVIDLGPLDEEVAIQLAVAQLGEDSVETAKRLVREAQGSPFFLIELTRYLQGRTFEQIAGKGLDAMLAERVDELGESARLVAEVVTVAGEPLTRRLLTLATALPAAELTKQLTQLRAQRLVRSTGSRADDTIEPWHDRVRETLAHALPEDRRARHHRALATALSGQGTAEQLARHWAGAGERVRAAEHARRAGDEARAKLDFDRAARCYDMALDGGAWSVDDGRALRTLHADALADAGRPREAAEQFQVAAEGSDPATGLELRRRASASLLQSGYVTEGLELTRRVLAEVGLGMSRTPLRSLATMLLRRAWLRIRGLGFKPRALAEISQAELTRVDVCESVSFGLAMVDPIRSMDFAARFLGAALRLGEPGRVARALALEADLLAALYKEARAKRLLGRLEELTPQLGIPNAHAQLLATRGFLDFFLDFQMRRSLDNFTQGIAEFRATVGRAGFELDTVSIFCCTALQYLGEFDELSRRVPAMAEAATRTGNRYTAVTLRCGFAVAWLARIEPEAIEADIEAALRSWTAPSAGYQQQHLFALCSRLDLAIYRGHPEDATPRIAEDWKPLRRSMIDRPPLQSIQLYNTIGRHALACAWAAAPGSARRRDAVAEVARIVRKFKKAPQVPMRACSKLLEGGLAHLDGRTDDAIAAYRACLALLETIDTEVFAHAVRDRLGRLVGGDEGAALIARTAAWLEAQHVREPARMLHMLLPGPA